MTRQQFFEFCEGGGLEKTRRFLRSLGADHDTARDVASAAWVKGYERIAQLRDPRCLVPWINIIALNLFRDQVASLKSTRQLLPEDELMVSREIDIGVLDLRRALAKCTPRHRQLLIAFYCHGYSTHELARQTGRSLGAVDSELFRAREELRQHMQVTRRKVPRPESVLRMEAKNEVDAPSEGASAA